MRAVCLAFVLLFFPYLADCEELSDIDMRQVVELADGVWKGDVIQVQEVEHHDSDGNIVSYRNMKVMVRTGDGRHRSFRASKIEGDWRLDEEEMERLEYVRNFISKLAEQKE